MPRYNVYKIMREREPDLRAKLQAVGLTSVFDEQVQGVRLTFDLSVAPAPARIWWAELYKEFIGEERYKSLKNAAYFGVCMISTDEYCYAISLGKAHFYLKNFCVLDFGIELGTRIISRDNIDQKSSRLFGGQLHRSILTYRRNTAMELDSGEAVVYLKGDSVSADWGDTVQCGHSVTLSLPDEPRRLPSVVARIEEELSKPPLFTVPNSIPVTDAEALRALDTKLFWSIRRQESMFRLEQQALSGVEFLFMPQYSLELKGPNGPLEFQSDVSLDKFNRLLDDSGLYLSPDNLDNIKIHAFSEYSGGFTANIRHFVDYVDDDWHYLDDGKWRKFNQFYVDLLRESVDQIPMAENCGFRFDNEAYEKHMAGLPQKEQKKWYRERFFNEILMAGQGYQCLDRSVVRLDEYSVEPADLYKNGILYFVKIGEPQYLGYVFDQSVAAIRAYIENHRQLSLAGGDVIQPHTLCVVLLLTRRTPVTRLSDVKSLILLMKADYWRKQVENAGLKAALVLDNVGAQPAG